MGAYLRESDPLLGEQTAQSPEIHSDDRPMFSQRLLHTAAITVLIILLAGLVFIGDNSTFDRAPRSPGETPVQSKRVALEAHIMSKCPDARDCLRDLVVPAMAQVSDKVNFTLSFIGQSTNQGGEGVMCKHGEGECLGNMVELCAAHLYPNPKINLGFTMCLTQEYQHIPDHDLIQDCALEHGVDFADLNECVSKDDGAFALGLLRDSFERTANAGVTMSCTVRLEDRFWCIRDGGEWKNCGEGHDPGSLVKAINKLYS